MIDELRSWIAAHLPNGAACRVDRISDHTAELLPIEKGAIVKAIPKRQAEFSTGRHLSRQCFADLGWPPVAIEIGQRRQPVWPDGISGSITHIGDLCAVAVAPSEFCRTIGIDLAICADVGANISQRTSTPQEMARNLTEVPDTCLHGCLFSIRESIFKAYYPITTSELDFADVVLRLDRDAESFVADITNPARPDLLGNRHIQGSFAVLSGIAVSLIALP